MENAASPLPEKFRQTYSINNSQDTVIPAVPRNEITRPADGSYANIDVTSYVDSSAEASLIIETFGTGQAISPLHKEPVLLQIGAGSDIPVSEIPGVVSESPALTTENLYEEAYWRDVARIREDQGQSANVYLTKWID